MERNNKIEDVEDNIRYRKMIEELKKRIQVKEVDEVLNFDQWRELKSPEEEMVV